MINKIFNRIIKYYNMHVLKDKFLLAHRKWVQSSGDEKLRLNYDLNENSVVFDLGGFKGEFTESIYNKYGSNVYVFEPVKMFFTIIKSKFKGNEKIKIFEYGLSNKDEKIEINLDEDGSSVHKAGSKSQTIQLRSVVDFINLNKIEQIELLKINIEGGEYEVLPALIESGLIDRIKNLQIQFHDFIPNAVQKRDAIRNDLSKTHKLTYDYYFVWENWEIN